MLVRSFLDYLKYERNYSDKTIVAYRKDIEQFRSFVKDDGGKDFCFIASEDVREWIVSLMDGGFSAASVNRKLSSLRSFYKFLMKKGEVVKDPLNRVVGPKKVKPLPVFLRESEMDELLDVVDYGDGFAGCRDRLILQMFYETGIRLAELVSLNVSDVDCYSSCIKVTGKRNKQRLIPFGSELKEAIIGYTDKRSEVAAAAEASFFIQKKGVRISRSAVYKLVKRNLSKVVVCKKKSPHVLRHTFATSMLNNEAELGVVKELLGHASLAATEVYTHTTFEELKKVYKQAHPRS